MLGRTGRHLPFKSCANWEGLIVTLFARADVSQDRQHVADPPVGIKES